MKPDVPPDPNQEKEARLTAYLLGELPAAEAEELRRALEADAELARLHARLQRTIDLVKEAASQAEPSHPDKHVPLRLSEERRQKLLQQFKMGVPTFSHAAPRRVVPWYIPLSAAALLIVLVAISVLSLEQLHKGAKGRTAAREARSAALGEEKNSRLNRGLASQAEQAGSVPKTLGFAEEPGLAKGVPVKRILSESEEFVEGANRESKQAQGETSGQPVTEFFYADGSEKPLSERREQGASKLYLPSPVAAGEKVVSLQVQDAEAKATGYARFSLDGNAQPAPIELAGETTTASGGMAGVGGGGFGSGGMGGAGAARGESLGSGGGGRAETQRGGLRGHSVQGLDQFDNGATLFRSAGDLDVREQSRAGAPSGVQPPSGGMAGRALGRSEQAKDQLADAAPKALLYENQLSDSVDSLARQNNRWFDDSIEQAPAPSIKPDAGTRRFRGRQLETRESSEQAQTHTWNMPGPQPAGLSLQPVPSAPESYAFASPVTGPAPASPPQDLSKLESRSGPAAVTDLALENQTATDFATLPLNRSSSVSREEMESRSKPPAAGPLDARRLAQIAEAPRQRLGDIAESAAPTKSGGVAPSITTGATVETLEDRAVAQRHYSLSNDKKGVDLLTAELEPLQKLPSPQANTPAFGRSPGTDRFGLIPMGEVSQQGQGQSQSAAGPQAARAASAPWNRSLEPAPLPQSAEGLGLKQPAPMDKALPELKPQSDFEALGALANGHAVDFDTDPATAESALKNKEASSLERDGTVARESLAPLRQALALHESARQESAPELERLSDEEIRKEARSSRPAPEAQPEVLTADNPFSTFSLNVTDVSFQLAAASLEKGTLPEPATVRAEEFINAFDYRDSAPAPDAPIAFAWERSRYPFAHNRDMIRLGIKTASIGRESGRPLNLVLLLDNSGSMERADRVRIVREALKVLASQLQPRDQISVVAFARTARLWIDALPGNQAGELPDRIGNLTPQGGTNLEEALNLAYQTAHNRFRNDGINRVVLLTDGAANLGNVDPHMLKETVERHRKQGVAFDCFGIGWEGYNDDLLETLTRNGDGRYAFLNTPAQAAADFGSQLAGALRVAASDVKVQVEFNPHRVLSYRQIGYAKHQLKKEEFRDNTVDAAEIGAAESGNALYAIQVNPGGQGDLGTVRVRYKIPGTSQYREQAWPLPYNGTAPALEQASPALRLAVAGSAFAEWLVSSPHAGEVTPDRLLTYLNGVPEVFGADPRPTQLVNMIRQAKAIAGQ